MEMERELALKMGWDDDGDCDGNGDCDGDGNSDGDSNDDGNSNCNTKPQHF